MYYIHYPSGGFGHFILQMSSICFDDVFCPQETSTFSGTGNSHSYPLHCKTWFLNNPFIKENYYDFKDKKSICLIDSGIDDYKDRGMKNTIRMCIDKDARSIVYQTCREKAERLDFNFDLEEYQIREQFSLAYHHIDKNPNFYLNVWDKTSTTTNINISDLFFNPIRVITQLEPHFGKCNRGKFWNLWNEFITANYKYYQAQHLVNRVKYALEADFDFEFTKNYSLHDQGYLVYWLEKQYNIQEIPPYDYKHWFKNTQEVRQMINEITNA
jgi:hypothetical protein